MIHAGGTQDPRDHSLQDGAPSNACKRYASSVGTNASVSHSIAFTPSTTGRRGRHYHFRIGDRMNTPILTTLLFTSSLPLAAETISFDKDPVGSLPAGWVAGVTGRGAPKWAIETDRTAPSAPNVLKQSGSGAFPWCVKKDVSLTDGTVQVKFKPISGSEDAAGGLVWRWKDGDNYYVARANALENNVSLYYTENGHRSTIKYVNAPVAKNQWHTLRVEFSGRRIKVALDGKSYIELDDDHIVGPGAVGVWTKADSVTSFDDFSYGSATKP
jgi:hypothetical protein